MTPDDQERTGVDDAAPDPEVPVPPVLGAPGRRSWVRRLVRALFLLVAVGAGTWFVVSRWDEVRAALAEVSLLGFVGSCLAGTAAGFLPMLAWRRLLADLGSPLPVAPAARVYFLSQLGKYVPGSIWTVVAQIDLARELKVPARRSAAGALLVLAISLLGGVLCAVITLPFAVPDLLATYWWVLLAVPLLLGMLHPKVVHWWSGLAGRLTGRGGDPVDLTYAGLGVALAWTMLSWLLFGVHLYLLTPALSEGGFSAFLLCAGLYGLAWTAGFLAIVVPAGAGIREAVLVLGLAPYLPAGGALVVALLSRVVATIVDASLAGIGVLMARFGRRPTHAG